MPILRNRTILNVARGIKAFLNVEAGVTRGEAPENDQVQYVREQLRRTQEQLEKRNLQLARLRANPDVKGGGTVEVENIIWMFGMARTGSTWLAEMMDEPVGHTAWREPLVGELFGNFHNVRASHRRDLHAILSNRPEGLRAELIRSFTLKAIEAKFPDPENRKYLVVKEPNGSLGAVLMSEAFPESRMIFLIRDPRDVVSSILSGSGEDGWITKQRARTNLSPSSSEPDEIVRNASSRCLEVMNKSKEAFESHKGPKLLVRYEELRADTPGTIERIYSELGVPMDGKEVSAVVEKHSWENIPAERKGEGKSRRKAKPGGWKEDLTPEQARTVERTTAPILREFYEPAAADEREK